MARTLYRLAWDENQLVLFLPILTFGEKFPLISADLVRVTCCMNIGLGDPITGTYYFVPCGWVGIEHVRGYFLKLYFDEENILNLNV